MNKNVCQRCGTVWDDYHKCQAPLPKSPPNRGMKGAATDGSASDPLAACRGCFWSSEITRSDARIWCAHATYHGWHTDQACRGDGYRKETRPPSSSKEAGKHFSAGEDPRGK